MKKKSTPTRTLRERPDLNQLRRQAKELLAAFTDGDAAAAAEVSTHYHGADPATLLKPEASARELTHAIAAELEAIARRHAPRAAA